MQGIGNKSDRSENESTTKWDNIVRPKKKTLLIVAIAILFPAGIITNLNHTKYYLNLVTEYSSIHSEISSVDSATSCYRARDGRFPPSSEQSLPRPFINVGLPNAGDGPLRKFFRCGNYTDNCMKQAIRSGKPPLSLCGQADAYLQLRRGISFQQMDYFNEIHKEAPSATFLLTFRGVDNMVEKAADLGPVDGPPVEKDLLCRHVQNIRRFVLNHPSHTLVEIDLSSPHVSERLEHIFGIQQSCWARKNMKSMRQREESTDDDNATSLDFSAQCFRPRKNVLPSQFPHQLPKPFINLGFPKMGTTTIQDFFKCGNYTSAHFYCGKRGLTCTKCISDSVQAGLPPLSKCDEVDIYSQIDNGHSFPQIDFLEEFMKGYPNATFFLNFRSMDKWYNSLKNWPPSSVQGGTKFNQRLRSLNIHGLPKGKGKNLKEFSEWFCWHVTRIRDMIAEYPQHTLVELDIEDNETGQLMEDMFQIKSSCWGHTNVNTEIHPELNQSEIKPSNIFKWAEQKKSRGRQILGKDRKFRSRLNKPATEVQNKIININDHQGRGDSINKDSEDNEIDGGDDGPMDVAVALPQGSHVKSIELTNYDSDEDDDGDSSYYASIDDADILSKDSSSGATKLKRNVFNTSIDKVTCFKANNNSVPPSLFGNLPKPYINLGFPKMGTSSLHGFFQCGGYESTHYRCGRYTSCTNCIKESVEAGLPPLSKCRRADVYAQVDMGHIFPQIDYLEEFLKGYSNATFFLTFRSMEKWYHSISHWPPRKNGPHMNDRMMREDIMGLPVGKGNNVEEFSEWFCWHVKRVRDLISTYPQHSLVEIDIEDPGTSEKMEKLFGVDKSCWGHSNVNVNIHPELNQSTIKASPYFDREANSSVESNTRKRGKAIKRPT